MNFENSAARWWLASGALLAAIGVSLGAFGAHGLQNYIQDRVADPAKSLEYWGTANRYLMYHSFAIMIVSLAALYIGKRKAFWVSNSLFVAGIVLFSGCLYVMALTDLKKLGMIVPLGGLSHILGWLTFALSIFAAPREGKQIS